MSDGAINRWLRRLAEMPNERPAKALFVALAVSFVCALAVSTAAVLLEPLQTANRERDRQHRILEIVQRLPGSEELLGEAGMANIRTDIVELATGHIVRSMDAAAYDQRKAATDPLHSVAIPTEHDIAGIQRRAKFAPVTVAERDGRIELITRLPIEKTIRPLLPLIAVLVVTMLFITYVEGFSMFLPRYLDLTE